ncbi:hypothetical protein ZHAS_00019769 [Anopheles sinensis]|uniref:Uncharacterized protein n=1 Tax=Anopheles sinensis TaxID=74873 RepID=A0A084WN90_ANOSI|nr:hypothetical protein ZHAS_00019769 [Anopheles sinensis]
MIYEVYRDSVFLFPPDVDITELTLRKASPLKSFIVGGVSRLRVLVIEQSSLDRIPPMVGKVRGLRIIWLTYSLLTELQLDALLNATELELLNVAFNRITRLSLSNTRGNSSLMDINLEGNRLESLDMSLFAPFVRLDRLTLTGNRLKQLESTKPINLPALKALTLERNNITDLSWINQVVLSQLKILLLADNAITQLPITWNTLPKLTTLGLQGNRLRTLDMGWFRSLKSVEQIYLAKNQLEAVFSSGPAFRWPSLKLLNLSNNRISKLNFSGCQMSSLSTLVLHDNLLQRIPPGIFQQSPALSLAIRNNPLKCSSLQQFRIQIVARKLQPAFVQASLGKTCSNTLLRIAEINQTICYGCVIYFFTSVSFVTLAGIGSSDASCIPGSYCILESVDLTKNGMAVLRSSSNVSIIEINKLILSSAPSGSVLLRLAQFANALRLLGYKDPVFQIVEGTDFLEISIQGKGLRSFVVNGINNWLASLLLEETSLDRIPATIGNLRALQQLNIYQSNIVSVNFDVFLNNRALQHLYIVEGRISQLSPTSDKDAILPITYLSLVGNRLVHLDMAVFRSLQNLVDINLSGNPIQSIDSSSLVTLPALYKLYAPYCNISKIDLTRVALPQLTRLLLHYNRLSSIPAQLGMLKSLWWITLTNNSIKDVDLALLGRLPMLNTIDIDNCNTERVYSSVVPLVLPSLVSLALYQNNLSRFNLTGIKLPSIKFITLGSNQLKTVPNVIIRHPELYMNLIDNPIQCDSLQAYKTAIASGRLVLDGIAKGLCSAGKFTYDGQGNFVCCIAKELRKQT